jgi:hypothetical protein
MLGALLAVSLMLLAFWVFLPDEGTRAQPAPQDEAPTAPAGEDPAAIGAAIFPHDEHVEDFEIECNECHHETNAAPLNVPHKDYFEDFWIDCKICHNDQGGTSMEPKGCSECHHSPNGDIADETLSAKVVIHKNCWECHDTGTGVEASATCADCHEE